MNECNQIVSDSCLPFKVEKLMGNIRWWTD